MITIRAFSLYVLCLLGAAAPSFAGEEPVCHHCEEIREYNAKYHENFEYYDDYLKENKEGAMKSEATSKQQDAAPRTSLPASQTSPSKK